MVAYRDCKGHLVCMADAQTGIVEIQHKDRAVRMTVPVGDSFTVTLRDTETVMTRISTRAFHVKKPSPCCVSTKENNKSAELQDGQDLASPSWGALCPGRLLFFSKI